MGLSSKNQKFEHLNSRHQKWRNYQTDLKRSTFKKRTITNTIKYACIAGFLMIAIYLSWLGIDGVFNTNAAKPLFGLNGEKKEPLAKAASFDKMRSKPFWAIAALPIWKTRILNLFVMVKHSEFKRV